MGNLFGMMRIGIHFVVVVVLTAISQLGGIAWLIGLNFRRRWIAFGICYAALSFAAFWMAPMIGRQALSCRADGALQMHSWGYCALNRQYVVPELKATLADLSEVLDQRFPGTVTLVLDAKVFIEPHLRRRLGVESSKLRFQGCRAARHDDHIHMQL